MDNDTITLFKIIGVATLVVAMFIASFATVEMLVTYNTRNKFKYCLDNTSNTTYCWNRYYLDQYNDKLPEPTK